MPPGFLDDLRTRISLSQVVGRKVVWDARKSNQGKGDMWAPCPFHQEKSASFHVDDRKGFYYCFGCHAKGDALTFLKETENLSFMEAVEQLAREAGMPMPARDPVAAQKADRRSQLAQVMEDAVQFMCLQLKTAAAAPARDYLLRRRLPSDAQDRWQIGWAPDARQATFAALVAKGHSPDLIIDSGVCARSDDGSIYDRFRGRIIFPIRDARGRAISLGGRSLDPNARSKYLNGPETDLFDKGRTLFNMGPAREAAGKGAPLIVAEGYMDVIALSEAGFQSAVAPLGTAVTEDQLRLMWRIHPEPVIALDGDTAGVRAALRVIDLALPLLEAGQGLRFAVLPIGLDPDDLIKAQGTGAMQAVIEAAQPMVNLLWQRAVEGQVFDSPERRAALDKTLRTALMRIQDPSIRGHYGQEIKRLLWDLYGRTGRKPAAARKPWEPARGPGKGWQPPPGPASAATKSSPLAIGDFGERVLEQVILATFVTHPALIRVFEADLETLDLTDPQEAALKVVLLHHAHDADKALLHEKMDAAQRAVVESLFQQSHVTTAPPVRNAADTDLARMCLAEGLAKLDARRGARREIEDAVQDLGGLADEGLTWRLSQATDALHRAEKSNLEDANDMGEDRAALSKHLQNLIDGEI